MSVCVECPICMDAIDMSKNCVTTECGHQFHAKCLMQNVAHNGFDCPYCRSTMAEDVEDHDDEEDSVYGSELSDQEVSELYSNRALYGMRQLFRMNSGEESDDETEEEDEYDAEEDDSISDSIESSIPVETVVEKFQSHYTYEQLIRIILQLNNYDYLNGPNRTDRDEVRMFEHFHRELDNVMDSYYANGDDLDEAAIAPPQPVEPLAEGVAHPGDHIAIPIEPIDRIRFL